MPILVDLTKIIEGKTGATYKIYSNGSITCTIINNIPIYHKFSISGIIGKHFKYAVTVSPKPTKISRIYCGDGYSDKTYFSKYHKFATYDCTTNAFKFCKLGLHVVEEVPLYIVDFIEYVSNYRYQNDLKEISLNELKELEDNFLGKYKNRTRRRK